MTMPTCPTCGGPVVVESGDEGTSYYRPATQLADLLTTAVRERAVACSDLADAKGTIATLRSDLRNAQLDLAVARELLAYHDLTIVEEAV